LKALAVIHYPVFGGPPNRYTKIGPLLAAAGVELTMLTTDEPGDAASRLREAGLDVVSQRLGRFRSGPALGTNGRMLASLPGDVSAIRRLLRERSIDVVMVNGLVNPQAAIAARLEGIPVVWLLLDTNSWPIVRQIFRPIVLQLADVVMSTGASVASAHLGDAQLGERLVLFFPPVDVDGAFAPNAERRRAARAELGLSEEDLVVGTVGNLTPMKGHLTFIRAAAELRATHPDARFLVLGAAYDYKGEYTRSLHDAVEQLGLSDRLEFRDPGSRVADLARAIDVFWMPSRPNSEGIPTAIGEAMSLEQPVVASRVGSIDEAVEEGVTGALVAADDAAALVAATIPYLDDPALRGEAGLAGRERARRLYSPQACADAHIGALELAIKHRADEPSDTASERPVGHGRSGPVAVPGAAGRSFLNHDAVLFLSKYYVKNLVLTRGYGRTYGLFLERTKTQWEELYAQIKGSDTWLVVGNGPSLRLDDLEAFDALGVPSIASNKINMVFNRTTWRPKLFTIADPLLLHKLPAEHYENIDRVLLPHTQVLMAKTPRKLPWRHVPDAAGQEKYLTRNEELHPLNGFFPGGTITVGNLQLAIWAGAKTVYVIGCDHFYANESSKTKSKKSAHQGSSNHFDPNYRQPGEIVNEAAIGLMNRGYATMREIAEQRGVRIINITRTSALDAYERDTVENALASLEKTQAQTVRSE
jgi:glycosyltransferase involved in cell wall biosynthesis